MTRHLVALKRSEQPAVRILCFHYAGGHAAFMAPWSRHLAEEVELFGVSYPTADSSPGAAPRSVANIADAVVAEVLACADLPLILFGYSLGALVAYQLSLDLVRCTPCLPAELVVAARAAPHVVSKKPPMGGLPDAAFLARLQELGGTPQAVLDNPEVLSFFMPLLRADILTAEGYRHTAVAPLPCPITAITGNADSAVSVDAVAAWESYTRGGFRLHQIEGNHFFLQQQPQAVIAILSEIARHHSHLALRKR
jgi:medium-chain acyl-[acyl-carrier-protein] hydrolase